MSKTYSQAIARPVRTGLQLLSANVVIEFIDSVVYDLSTRQYSASVALLTMLIGFLQVLVEDKTGKGILRVPSPPAQPVEAIEEAPYDARHDGIDP